MPAFVRHAAAARGPIGPVPVAARRARAIARRLGRRIGAPLGTTGRVAAALLAVGLAACHGGEDTGDVAGAGWAPPHAAAAAALDEQRPAGAGTTVVLALRASGAPSATSYPLRLTGAEVLGACVDDGDPHLLALRITARDGTTLREHERGAPCPEPAPVPGGDYTVTVIHDVAADADRSVPVFMHTPTPDGPPRRLTATAAEEYWVVRFARTGQVLSVGADGRLRTVGGDTARNPGPAQWFALRLRTTPEAGEQRVLVPFGHPDDPVVTAAIGTAGVRLAPGGSPVPLEGNGNGLGPIRLAADRVSYCVGDPSRPQSSSIWYRRNFCLGQRQDGELGFFEADPAVDANWSSLDPAYPSDAGVMVVNARVRLDACSMPLARGQVTVSYPPAGLPCGGLLFDADSPFPLPDVRQPVVRLGPGTAVSFDAGRSFVTRDGPVNWAPGATLTIRSTLQVLVSSRSCVGCDLSGMRLVGCCGPWPTPLDLFRVDLTRAVLRDVDGRNVSFGAARLREADFTGADLRGALFRSGPGYRTELEGTNFERARLEDADFLDTPLACTRFGGATLTGATFRGTRFQCVDMRGATVSGAEFDPELALRAADRPDYASAGQLCASQVAAPDGDGFVAGLRCGGLAMAGATVWPESPPTAQWRRLDLAGARLRKPREDTPEPADLSGADFTGARFRSIDLSGVRLRGARFDGADLAGANLTRTDLSPRRTPGTVEETTTSFAGANLRGARMAYANAKKADFSGAFFSGDPSRPAGAPDRQPADLSYLYAPDARFAGAVDLTGVNLAFAQVYGPNAVLRGTLVRANFSNATLSKVDFRESRLQGADFTGANLVCARFDRAAFGQAELGLPTRFAGAMLQGASFADVTAPATLFTGATVSFEPGSIRVVREVSPGQLGPATEWFGATVPPRFTDASSTCPDGGGGECTWPTRWLTSNPVQPRCVPAPDQPCPPVAEPPIAHAPVADVRACQ